MPVKVPSVIQVEDDAVSIVSEVGSRHSETTLSNDKQIAVLNGRRKRVLTHSNYTKAIDTIIQRDYFPNQLANPSNPSSTTTLTGFHAKAASDRQVSFHLGVDRDAADLRTHVETTKYQTSCTDQNPVFFPVVPPGKPKNRWETLPMSLSTGTAGNTSSLIAASSPRNIVPAATRFPQPKPKVPQHWENSNSTMDDASGVTDLDSTIVHSLRSEIRRGKLRKMRRRQQPPLNSDESIGYALRKAYKRPRKSSSTTSSVKR